MVNFPYRYPVNKFKSPNLCFLSLTNIKHDGFSPSGYLEPIVSILKTSRKITFLELSMSKVRGGFRVGYEFEPNYDDSALGMLEALCLQYKEAGGRPLHLNRLQLGRGCHLLGIVGPDHFLHVLTDLACLEELHIGEDRSYEELNIGHDAPYEDFNSERELEAFGIVSEHLPNLRKLTWPCPDGFIIEILLHRINGPEEIDYLGRSFFDSRHPKMGRGCLIGTNMHFAYPIPSRCAVLFSLRRP